MNKEEFQLRYMWYEYMSERFDLGRDESFLLKLSQKTQNWKINKKLTETSPEELKEATINSYTDFKIDFLKNNWSRKLKKNFTIQDYIERLEYELKVIDEMWYNTYFLIVQDYIMYAKTQWIMVGPWRGSSAWSLLSYFIRITEIDPLEYDLLFERFLNPARISMPDIDTDFEDTEREKIIEYCKKKYWIDKVANIWTYMTMAAKASFKDVARVFWISFTRANQISWFIEKNIKTSYEENKEFKELVDDDDTLKKVLDFSSYLEWTTRQLWVHACWVIISPQETYNYTAVQYPPKAWTRDPDFSRLVTQYDWHFLEDIGLLKMDFLWLRNLSIIKNTIKIIEKKSINEWKSVDRIFEEFKNYCVFEPPIQDKKAFKIFQNGDTIWVFQFESDWMRSWLRNLKPNSIDDIIAMVSLYRPWPMERIPNYINRKSWSESVSYISEEVYNLLKKNYWKEVADKQKDMITMDLSPFMDVTYWIPVYQEQLMRIVQAMADFSLGEADLLRRWVWKKIKELIDELKWEFVSKAEKKWYKQELSIFVYEKMIEPASNYSFNKSHAACYAAIAYQTSYLKAYYPVEFYAALLRSVEENTERFAELLEELKIKWIKIQQISVNKSYNHVAAVWDSVLIGFLAIKWIWYEVWKFIETENKTNWKYKSLEDFLLRCEKYVNKKTIESLVFSWALDEFEDRAAMFENIDKILERTKHSKQQQENAWMSLFGEDILQRESLNLKSSKKLSRMDKLWLEHRTFWTFVSSHPFDGIYTISKKKYNFSNQVRDENFEWNFKLLCFVKNIVKTRFWWFFLETEDIVWNINFYIKNIAWLELFDVILIEWSKQKRLNIQKITKINLNKFLENLKVQWKFNKKEIVSKIRAQRNIENLKQYEKTPNKVPMSDNILSEDRETEVGLDVLDVQSQHKQEKSDKNPNLKELSKNHESALPSDIDSLKKLAELKKENPDSDLFELDWKIYKIK